MVTESALLEATSVEAELVSVAVLFTGGLPKPFTSVTILIVTTSVTFKLPPRVTTTVKGAVPVAIGGVTLTSVPSGAPLTVTSVTSKADGSTSVTTTLGAGEFPWFVTTRVNVTVSPTVARLGLPDLDNAGSATCTEVVGVLESVLVGVPVEVLVAEPIGVVVGVSVGVLVAVFVGVSVGVLVGLFVAVPVGVSVGVAVGVFVGVSVGVFVGV